MIAYLIDPAQCIPVVLRDLHVRVRILNTEAEFIRQDHIYILTVKHPLHFLSKNPIRHQSMDKLQNKETGQICLILYSLYDKGYEKYRRYEYPGKMTIGNDVNDTLYLQDSNLKPSQFSIDFKNKIISDDYGNGIGSLNEVSFRRDKFMTGDLFACLNLRIVFGKDYFLLNSVENLYHDLKLCRMLPVSNSCESRHLNRIVSHQREVFPILCLQESLEEPARISEPQDYPLIFSMGPALTMSSASLMSGSITVYRQYMAGRELIEVLPILLLPAIMILSTLLWNPLQRRYQIRKLKREKERRLLSYQKYINDLSAEWNEQIVTYRLNIQKSFLDSSEICELQSCRYRLWQKTRNHKDWLTVFLGTGRIRMNANVEQKFSLSRSDDLYPLLASFKNQFEFTEDMPVLLHLKPGERITAESDHNLNDLFLSLLIQLTVYFGYDQLGIAAVCTEKWLNEHAWIRMIPHMHNSGHRRMIAVDREQAEKIMQWIQGDLRRNYVLFVENAELIHEMKFDRAAVIYLSREPGIDFEGSISSIFLQDKKGILTEKGQSQDFVFQSSVCLNPDQFFYQMSQCRIHGNSRQDISMNCSFFSLNQVRTAESLNIRKRWNQSCPNESLNIKIGTDCQGQPVFLDLHEKGQGPHGLLAGTTGSGKSEWIMTLLLSLAVNFHPRDVQFILIDFKGGGITQAFSQSKLCFPHNAGMITNLDSQEMERARESFSCECRYREKMMHKMADKLGCSIMNLDQYQNQWKQGCGFPYLSHLIIIVDEFAELKKWNPEFLTDLISIARIGRSLGIHLILSTQKPAGVIDDQIWSNSRFKICMKVQDRQDSIEILHIPDAAEIHDAGQFYMLCDGKMQFAQAAYSNAPAEHHSVSVKILDETGSVKQTVQRKNRETKSQLYVTAEEIVRLAEDDGFQPKHLWYDPLKEQNWSSIQENNNLILGRIDDYYHQSQPLYQINLQKNHHIAVFSIDRSEKIKFIHTLLYSLLSLLNPNDELYLIDDLGLGMEYLNQCPMINDILNSEKEEMMRNLWDHLSQRKADIDHECHIIITHFPELVANQENEISFHRILERSQQLKVHFYVFQTIASSIRYSDLSFINERISLYNENRQDLSAIFEVSVKKDVSRKSFGMIRRENLLDFRMIETSEEQLKEKIRKTAERYGNQKRYHLPCMPEHISLSCYLGSETAFGIRKKDYSWFSADQQTDVMILATYEDELYPFYVLHKKSRSSVYFMPDENQLKIIREQRGYICFLTLDQYQKNKILRNESSILMYVGNGFENQYIFTSRFCRALKYNEAVVYRKGENEVIQLAEQ